MKLTPTIRNIEKKRRMKALTKADYLHLTKSGNRLKSKEVSAFSTMIPERRCRRDKK
jgi:hypothetical protein